MLPVGSPNEGRIMTACVEKPHKEYISLSFSDYSFCTCSSYLFIDLIGIQCFSVGISAGMERAHKLIVVDETVVVHVKDVGDSVHL